MLRHAAEERPPARDSTAESCEPPGKTTDEAGLDDRRPGGVARRRRLGRRSRIAGDRSRPAVGLPVRGGGRGFSAAARRLRHEPAGQRATGPSG